MFKSVLLVLDGQPADHGAVDLGIRWSKDYDVLLVGLGVIDEKVVHPLEAVPIGAGHAKQMLDAARLHEQRLVIGNTLSNVALRCARAGAAFKPLEHVGSPVNEVLVEAQRFDLIIMPRQADDGSDTGHWIISDVLRTILHLAPRPVVAVPETLPKGNAIVVAYDGSLQAARTLCAFEASGLAARHPVHVISIADDHLEAARCGNRANEFLGVHGIRATLSAMPGDAAEQIMNFAREVDAGLIVLGAYGKPRIREFFLGSVTNSILTSCPLPLFLFH